MSRSSGRAQVEPLPALAAVFAVTLALGAFAGVTASLPDGGSDPSPAVPALKRVEAAATTGAVLAPARLSPRAAGLDGYRVNVTLAANDSRWTAGPQPPRDATAAAVHVAVGTGDVVVPGRLRVEVWPWAAQ